MARESLFCCPLCAAPLTWEPEGCVCPSGHRFDRAGAGYVHLLPPNRKHSASPGDDKEMVAARAAFLEAGYYAPLRQALQELVLQAAQNRSRPSLLDCGCGEGYYTAGLFQALDRAGLEPRVAGVDISKFALRRAAKRLKEGEFAVASAYHLPVSDARFDLLTDVFSPLCPKEFARVVKPGGWFFYVVPAPRHLWEMKEILYDRPYENQEKRENYPGFVWRGMTPVSYTAHVEGNEAVMALLGMTPYAWKTPKAGVARLRALSGLTTQIGFHIHAYQRLNQEKE